MVRNLPTGTVETFTRNIQPILMYSCATTNCHGPGGKSNFQLSRVPIGRPAGRIYTRRNLYETLKHVDFTNPQQSRFLTNAHQPHGGIQLPVMTTRHMEQFRSMLSWTIQVAGGQQPAQFATPQPAAPQVAEQPAAAQPIPQIATPSTDVATMHQGSSNTILPPFSNPIPATSPQLLPQDASDARLLSPARMAAPVGNGPITAAGHWQYTPDRLAPVHQAAGRSTAPPLPTNTPNEQTAEITPETSIEPTAANPPLTPAVFESPIAATTESEPAGTATPAPENTNIAPQQPRVTRGNPRAGLFEPQDDFDPELFNRRYHGNPQGSITFGSAGS